MAPNDLAPSYNAAVWSVWGVAAAFVALRFYCRRVLTRSLGADDWVMLLSLLVALAANIALSICFAYGTGKHIDTIPPDQLVMTFKTNVIATQTVILIDSPAKLAVALLIVRILQPKRWTKWILLGAAWLFILLATSCCLVGYLQCSPPAHQWDPEIKGTCLNRHVITYLGVVAGAWGSFLDFLYSIYPCFVVLRLRMSWSKRIAVASALGLGFFASGLSIYRTVLVPTLLHQRDITYYGAPLLLWTQIAGLIIIIAGCIPTLGPCFYRVRESVTMIVRKAQGSSRGQPENWQHVESEEKLSKQQQWPPARAEEGEGSQSTTVAPSTPVQRLDVNQALKQLEISVLREKPSSSETESQATQ